MDINESTVRGKRWNGHSVFIIPRDFPAPGELKNPCYLVIWFLTFYSVLFR